MSRFGDNNDSNPYYGSGGGYLSQGSPGGSPGGSSARRTSHSLRSVTLKQLVEATQEHSDADWKIGDVEIGQVTVVAHVLSVQAQTTNCVYLLNDGTAQFEARQWVDANSDEDGGKREISEGHYVYVMGTLKVFGQKRYITATHIEMIPDAQACDRICYHFIEVATMTLIFERGPPPRPSEGSMTDRAGGSSASAYTTQAHSSAATKQEHAEYAHLPPLQKQIVEFMLSQPSNQEGVNVGAIARYVASHGGSGDAHTISKALDGLADDGLVFTTFDDSHFQLSR